jgi:lipopolysaccharide biosynthesis glycosyltransferase/GT2 family glycosyltransferase
MFMETLIKPPRISVVMSTYNRAEMLKEAMDSILNQTYTDFEFIIIDDASTDNSVQVIKEYARKDKRIVYIQNKKNTNFVYNLRKGFEISRGEYIARMDDDDVSLPLRFEKQVEFLDRNKDIAVVGTFIEEFGESARSKIWFTEWEPEFVTLESFFICPVCQSSIMIRKSFLDVNKLTYNPKALFAEEVELCKDITLKGGKIANIPEVLHKYRRHNASVTLTEKTHSVQHIAAVNAHAKLFECFFSKRESKILAESLYAATVTKKNEALMVSTLIRMAKKGHRFFPQDAIYKYIEKIKGGPSVQMHIFFSFKDNYAQHAGTAMTSIIKNMYPDDKISFYILSKGLSRKSIRLLDKLHNENIDIEYIKVSDDRLGICPVPSSAYSKECYYRYLIPEVKPYIDKCIYIDCDVIVSKPLNDLWNIDLGNNFVAATKEVAYGISNLRKLQFDTYFNSGMMLINNKKWRNENVTNILFENTKKLHDKIVFTDQDVLNYTFGSSVVWLDPKFHCERAVFDRVQPGLYSDEQYWCARHCPVISHFTGPVKPWNETEKRICQHGHKALYFEYLKQSPFKSAYYAHRRKLAMGRLKRKIRGGIKCVIQHGLPYTVKLFVKKVLVRLHLWNVFVNFMHLFYKQIPSGDFITHRFFLLIKFNTPRRLRPSELLSRIDWWGNQIRHQNEISLSKIDWWGNRMANQIRYQNAISYLHQKTFPQFKYANSGRDVVVAGAGPTLNYYTPINGAVHIGVNRTFMFEKIDLDYFFTLDYPNIKPYLHKISVYRPGKCQKFYGLFPELNNPLHIPDSECYKTSFLRYYVNYSLYPHEEFFYDIENNPLANFWSVTFQAIQFGLYTNPDKLYLVGCDFTFGSYFNKENHNLSSNDKQIQGHVAVNGDGWNKLKKYVRIYYPETEIISINPVGLRGMFEDRYTQEYLDDHPEIDGELV